MERNITKKCKACEIKFDKLKHKEHKPSAEFEFPKDIPVSETMRNSVNIIRRRKQ